MFIILLSYKKDPNQIDLHLEKHRQFLDRYYENGTFIMSGPKVPRTGGIIIANANNRQAIDLILKEDPFYEHGIANYEVIEFNPTKHRIENLAHLLK